MFGRQATGADDLHRRRRHDHHPGRRLYEQESLGLRDRHAERRPWRADHPRRLRLGCRPAVRRTALVLVRVRRHRVSRLAHLRAACGPAAPRAESCWRSESCCGIESVHTTLDSLDGLSDRTACAARCTGARLATTSSRPTTRRGTRTRSSTSQSTAQPAWPSPSTTPLDGESWRAAATPMGNPCCSCKPTHGCRWNETQPVEVKLAAGKNTLSFTRTSVREWHRRSLLSWQQWEVVRGRKQWEVVCRGQQSWDLGPSSPLPILPQPSHTFSLESACNLRNLEGETLGGPRFYLAGLERVAPARIPLPLTGRPAGCR